MSTFARTRRNCLCSDFQLDNVSKNLLLIGKFLSHASFSYKLYLMMAGYDMHIKKVGGAKKHQSILKALPIPSLQKFSHLPNP